MGCSGRDRNGCKVAFFLTEIKCRAINRCRHNKQGQPQEGNGWSGNQLLVTITCTATLKWKGNCQRCPRETHSPRRCRFGNWVLVESLSQTHIFDPGPASNSQLFYPRPNCCRSPYTVYQLRLIASCPLFHMSISVPWDAHASMSPKTRVLFDNRTIVSCLFVYTTAS